MFLRTGTPFTAVIALPIAWKPPVPANEPTPLAMIDTLVRLDMSLRGLEALWKASVSWKVRGSITLLENCR